MAQAAGLPGCRNSRIGTGECERAGCSWGVFEAAAQSAAGPSIPSGCSTVFPYSCDSEVRVFAADGIGASRITGRRQCALCSQRWLAG